MKFTKLKFFNKILSKQQYVTFQNNKILLDVLRNNTYLLNIIISIQSIMKLRNKIIAGSFVLLVISIALLQQPGATAEKSSDKSSKKVEIPSTLKVTDVVDGEGAIIDNSGNLFEGHYQFRLFEIPSAKADHNYLVKNGQFIIENDENRLKFVVDPNTWTFTENGEGFKAQGEVTDKLGTTFQVSLDGDMIHGFKEGCVYAASGTLSDGLTSYHLQYSSTMTSQTPHTHEGQA